MNIHTCERVAGRPVGNLPAVLLLDRQRHAWQLTAPTEGRPLESCDLVVAAHRQSPGRSSFANTSNAFYRAWRDIEAECNSCSIGLIAAAGDGAEAAGRVISEGVAGGPLPGAIALIRFDAAFFALCRQLSESLPEPPLTADWRSRDTGGSSVFEWPPMMVFLPDGDPAVLPCARACRGLRANGVPICLEIVPSVDWTDAAICQELRAELDRFFGAHLIPAFPKLL